MRELRFVQQAFEGSILVLEAENGEQFVVPVEQIRDGVGAAEPPEPARPAAPSPSRWPGAGATPAGAELGPREIQLRVRAGESAEALAEESGMALDRVMRFALPVLEERARITDEARRARARRAAGEAATLPFGETVEKRFLAHGIDPTTVRWDSRRREDRQWVVTAAWERDGEQYGAEWTYTRPGRVVGPVDDAAAELLSDRPIPLSTTPAAPRLTLAPPVVAFPPMPEASTAPIPVLPEPELFDQESTERGAARDPWQDVVSPPLPLALTEQREDEPARRPQRTRQRSPRPAEHPSELPRAARGGGSAARSPVPSWDDILLGVRRERE